MADEIKLIIKDPHGVNQEYPIKDKLRLNTTEGEKMIYSKGEAQEKTVELDFSEGDMVLTPDEGTLWNQVNIPIPANLLPENIAKDVDIGGIVGTLGGNGTGNNNSDVVLLAWSNSRATQSAATASTMTIWSRIVLPANSKIIAIVGGTAVSGSNTTGLTGGYGFPSQSLSLNPTVSTSTSGNLIVYEKTVTTGSYKYTGALSTLIMMVSVPGLRVITDASTGEVLLHAAASVTALPYALAASTYNGYGVNWNSYGITKIDLSESGISNDFGKIGADNTVLTSVVLPAACTEVGSEMFYQCTALTSVTQGDDEPTSAIYLPNVTTLDWRAFYNCKKITSVYTPNVATLSNVVFEGCTALAEIYIPLCTEIGSGCFRNCTKLLEIFAPLCTSLDSECFRSCSSLVSVILGDVTSIPSYAFYNCSSLITLDLRLCSTVPTLASSAFSTPNSLLSIYVPAALYDEWIASTNWANYADYIVAV